MSRTVDKLNPRFLTILKRVIKSCNQYGYDLRPYYTIRNPWEQARLYRQSRTWKEINDTIDNLNENGASFLADILLEVGPQYGRWATNAPPGYSWHQYGEACDLFVYEKYKAIWNPSHDGYICFYDECINKGITNLRHIGDINHCQLKKHSPSWYYRADTINKKMKELYIK